MDVWITFDTSSSCSWVIVGGLSWRIPSSTANRLAAVMTAISHQSRKAGESVGIGRASWLCPIPQWVLRIKHHVDPSNPYIYELEPQFLAHLAEKHECLDRFLDATTGASSLLAFAQCASLAPQ